jgi:uncharacterized protein YecT (DUF1311 family)
MKKMLSFVLLSFAPTFVFPACHSSNVYESIACYEKELKMSKAKLNHTYQTLFKSLDDEGKKVLENSQKNWLSYKNSHCDELVAYLSSDSQGGGSKLINLSCNAELIDQRIKQLKSLDE